MSFLNSDMRVNEKDKNSELERNPKMSSKGTAAGEHRKSGGESQKK